MVMLHKWAPGSEALSYADGNRYEGFFDVPNGSKQDNNTMIIAMSVTTAGLLAIILIMMFFVPRRSRS